MVDIALFCFYNGLMNRNQTTMQMILCAFFAALTAVLSQIALPLPFTPVPVNLATLSVFLSGALLGAKYGALSQFLFVLLGGIGLPVFSQFNGGLGVLAGPTGGYLVGYILASFVTGLLTHIALASQGGTNGTSGKSGKGQIRGILAMTAGLLVCYTLGTAWFVHLTGTGLVSALLLCILPFLPGDALKIFLAASLLRRLSRWVRFNG